ncbi:MAG: lipid A deacylase LpxR family protein [Alphaproteobacteria bacterium]|nr:lipid A deacylase LpxR family protein [Alphaproteobacteria bacterium]
MPVLRVFVLCGLVALAAAAPAHGAEDRASFSVLVENDSFGGTDRHYTNGLKASWLSKKGGIKGLSRWLARALPLFPKDGDRRIGFAVGQNIYSPADLSATTLQTEDRPYAGWLYGELGLTAQTRNRLDSVALSLGVIGPASQADDVQKAWHRLFNITRPRGWEHQLNNEPALNISYQHRRRYFRENTPFFGLDADVMPHLGLSLGNVFTYGAAGLTVRFGDDFAGDFGGPPRIRPSMPGAGHFQSPASGFGWYLFAGIEGRAVARNIFLDGNTFTDSHSVDKKTFVGDAQLGFALIFRRFRITYTQVLRTFEFDGQATPHTFGAISLTANF